MVHEFYQVFTPYASYNGADSLWEGDVCWPCDLLKSDVPRCRIFTWSYESSVVNLTKGASHATISGYAESFLQDITITRETKDEVPLA